MPAYFFDSSAVVERYVAELGSDWTTSLIKRLQSNGTPPGEIYLASITLVEVSAAMARRQRGGTLSAADYASARAQFHRDISQRFILTELTADKVLRAMTAAEQHCLRGYDAVQLAVAVALNSQRTAASLPPLIFVSADIELLDAAVAEGLPVDNPNLHP